MRLFPRLLVVLVLLIVASSLLVACGGSSLDGTTWKGGNIMDNGVTLSFTSGSQCSLHTSFMGSPSGTYSMSDNQVSTSFGGKTYVFAIDGNVMQGNLFGAGVTLAKQQ